MGLNTIRFIVPGEPKSKSRPRHGKGRTYSDPDMVAAEAKVAAYFRQKLPGWRPRPDMIHMTCTFVVGSRHNRDLDNLVKLVRDALNGVAYIDDRQITSDRNRVIYQRGNPRTIIRIKFSGQLQWPDFPKEEQ